MEVLMPRVTSPDFNFDSTCSSPYISAPSTPKHFGFGGGGGADFYFSAPTSPTSSSSFYHEFNNLSFIDRTSNRASSIPFDWEEKPGTPKLIEKEKDEDFAFDFSGQLEKSSVSADELFDGGKIKPLKSLKLPPRLLLGNEDQKSAVSSPRSPRSPMEKFRNAFSPKQRKEFDPFEIAMQESRKEGKEDRGRERVSQGSKPCHRSTRSLSPFRVSYEPEAETEQLEQSTKTNSTMSKQSSSAKGYRKWRLRDFLLFRSASEGRASEKDPLRKYSAITKKNEDVKNSSFRSTDSSGSGSASRRRGQLSAHELHYRMNRTVSEELKKKTYLPYKQGLFGCMGFSPAVKGLARGLNM